MNSYLTRTKGRIGDIMKIKRTILSVAITLMMAATLNAQDLGKLDTSVQKQIGSALDSYYSISDALVKSSVSGAREQAAKFQTDLVGVDLEKMNVPQKQLWEKLYVNLKSDAEHIGKSDDIERQREHFAKLSNNMYSLVFKFKANEKEAYLHYCPMKKVTWLSKSKEVLNPYYGEKMLSCGSVKATLKKQKTST